MARLELVQLQFMKIGSKRSENASSPSASKPLFDQWIEKREQRIARQVQRLHIDQDMNEYEYACQGQPDPTDTCGYHIGAPHCDQRVMHRPSECRLCDDHPEMQQIRETWGINYTGEYDPEKLPCPAEVERSLESINDWGGNQPIVP